MARVKVFISHIAKETELAQILKRHLDKDFLGILDIYVSSDGETIRVGSKWLDGLSTALQETQIEIVLCSKESVGRPWVNFEAGAGWVRGIPVIPVCHSGMNASELPLPLNMLQAVHTNKAASMKELYEAIAKTLDMQTPTADFETIVEEINELDEKYKKAAQVIETITNPRILCAASPQYSKLDFDLDVAVLQKYFPKQVTVVRDLSSMSLCDLLTGERFDIIHLVIAVDPENGDLAFHPIRFDTLEPMTSKIDRMSSEGFVDLLVESQTRLVVLATCNALHLAVKVSHVANMIACHNEIDGKTAAKWGDRFYNLLTTGRSVHKAYKVTETTNKTPLLLIRQKDVIFDVAKNML